MKGSGLCTDCSKKNFTCDIGECEACGAHTSSGAIKLCDVCAAKKGICASCRVPRDVQSGDPASIVKGED